MPRKTGDKKEEIFKKLDYIGLDLENIPADITYFEPLKYRIPKFYEENQYKQYRYIPIREIQILLSPTNRLDDLEERYHKASPIAHYLDQKTEAHIEKHATFLRMLNEVKIKDIEKVEQEQAMLNKKIPFKVKYEGNYLWQIYYSENTDQYFMIVPTEDSDYSTFFYLLKKQLEKKKTGKIFVPISSVQYTKEFLKKSEFEDMANYLWLLTKDWPFIYEVFDKQGNLNIHITGETNVYEKIKSPYKILLKSKEEANEFYKLLKAMFIMQTELPHYFEFKTSIGKAGELEFYFKEEKVEFAHLSELIKQQYQLGEEQKQGLRTKKEEVSKKLANLKMIVASQEIEYLAKEKQISTFLQCKKSFFGKFKYYFKYNKKNEKNKTGKIPNEITEEIEEIQEEELLEKKTVRLKKNYTIEELVECYQELENLENEVKNNLLDINALKLKNKNMTKKLENATCFIEEIDNHKKSIFEFWKYSNKDELAVLPEGEEEEVNVIKKITKLFDYEEDFEKLGIQLDNMQRANLSKEELDSVSIAMTDLLPVLNKIKNNEVTPQEIENSLKEVKKEAKNEKVFTEKEDFDIFGGMVEDSTKVRKIKNHKHRELARDKFNILEINKNTKAIGYKLTLEQIVQKIKKAFEKQVLPEEIPIYKAVIEDKLQQNDYHIFNINPESEMKAAIDQDKSKINFYKINVKQGANGIAFTNIVFFDNQNKTLPVGMDLSTRLIVDLSKWNLELKKKETFKMAKLEDETDDFSKIMLKTVTVWEYDWQEE